jgi:membrane protease YdiL (CAAX protease family)
LVLERKKERIHKIAVLLLYLSAAFALALTVFHYKRFLKKGDDFRAFLLYFASFFFLFFAIPCGLIFILNREPFQFLKEIGCTLGSSKKGFSIAAIGAPLAVLAGFIGSRDAELRRFYPFSKRACRGPKKFMAYETAYLFLYYLPWEFLYRGILFFPFVSALGLIPALCLQTILSTLYHIGHPDSEIFASLAAGFLFGGIAYITGSFFYTTFLHALVGISTDIFIYRRDYKFSGAGSR